MRVSELSDFELDAWVACAKGMTVSMIDGRLWRKSGDIWRAIPSYCAEWKLAGPIIQREGFGIVKFYELVDGPIPEGSEWAALTRDDSLKAYGPTPTIAAMQLFVASKFGEEVEDIEAPQTAG